MPSFRAVLNILGGVVMAFAVAMLVPLGVAAWIGESHIALRAYEGAAALTFGSGLVMWLGSRRAPRDLEPRDGILLVALVWTVLPLFASAPLLPYFHLAGAPISFTDAYFEAMSGLTTTGATILTGLDQLPGSINLWRCLLQWIGGMGILILAVAILPLLGVGGSQLFRAEAAGPMKEAKLTPRIAETAKGLWIVYSGMSLACLLAYWSAGMSWMDAWTHMFATVSLGGLSSHDASFGYFQSAELEWICVIFMLIASCNFAVYFVALKKRTPGHIFGDPEVRGTLIALVGASVLVACLLLLGDPAEGTAQTIRHAFFNVVSIGSTTGFSTLDHTAWPPVASVLMLVLSGVATSAGSTGAGIKMIRVIILFKHARREMRKILHPRAVAPVMLDGRPVANETIFAVLAFMLVYGVAIIVFTLVLMASGLSFDVGFSAAVASINNMGPGLGAIGPAGTFEPLTDFQTWVCAAAMLLGRLELLSVLVLFTPQFWRQ